MSATDLALRIEAFLRRKYVVRRSRDIDYLTAAVDDLANELAKFIDREVMK
jgi:hypothetical protein